jgi:hypothetical protein
MEIFFTTLIVCLVSAPFVYAFINNKGRELKKYFPSPAKMSIIDRIEKAIFSNGFRFFE